MRPSWAVRLSCLYFAFLFFCQLVCAAHALSETSHSNSTPRSLSPSSTPTEPSLTRAPDVHGDGDESSQTDSQTVSSHRPSNITTSSHSLIIPPTQHHTPHTTWLHTDLTTTHHFPPPTPPVSPGSPQSASQPPTSKGQSVVAIVFEVLAGVAALFILLALGRCYYSYRRTPSRDRIGALLNRHRLDREMEEMERARMERFNRVLESHRWRPPPPPYQQAPAYDAVVSSGSDHSVDWGRPATPPTSHSPPL